MVKNIFTQEQDSCLTSFGCFVWLGSVQQNPIDAIPDLSENQVIVFTEWMGRSPQVIEDQVTYPLVSNLQGIPKSKTFVLHRCLG
jgi:Cu/Ag efflux pump CusA